MHRVIYSTLTGVNYVFRPATIIFSACEGGEPSALSECWNRAAISRGGGKGRKPGVGFPGFPQPGISTGLPGVGYAGFSSFAPLACSIEPRAPLMFLLHLGRQSPIPQALPGGLRIRARLGRRDFLCQLRPHQPPQPLHLLFAHDTSFVTHIASTYPPTGNLICRRRGHMIVADHNVVAKATRSVLQAARPARERPGARPQQIRIRPALRDRMTSRTTTSNRGSGELWPNPRQLTQSYKVDYTYLNQIIINS